MEVWSVWPSVPGATAGLESLTPWESDGLMAPVLTVDPERRDWQLLSFFPRDYYE
jgi:hypothetical protein